MPEVIKRKLYKILQQPALMESEPASRWMSILREQVTIINTQKYS